MVNNIEIYTKINTRLQLTASIVCDFFSSTNSVIFVNFDMHSRSIFPQRPILNEVNRAKSVAHRFRRSAAMKRAQCIWIFTSRMKYYFREALIIALNPNSDGWWKHVIPYSYIQSVGFGRHRSLAEFFRSQPDGHCAQVNETVSFYSFSVLLAKWAVDTFMDTWTAMNEWR